MEGTPGGRGTGQARAIAATLPADPADNAFGWRLGIPFVLVHVACIAVVFVGVSPIAIVIAVASYTVRLLGITAFYHRCFAHRSFRVGRGTQLIGAILGSAAAQRGPLWWVAHHRVHHRYTDRPGDPHSPVVLGFWRSHVLWIFAPANRETALERVPDLAQFRELRLLDRFHHVVPAAWLLGCAGLGAIVGAVDPTSGTSAAQLAIWGFVLPTVALYHATFAVNSIAHRFGRRRFATPDESRNNWLVAAMTLGEGWHNNHHRFPNTARQGYSRLEADPTWWLVRALEALGLARNVRRMPVLALAMTGSAQDLDPPAGPAAPTDGQAAPGRGTEMAGPGTPAADRAAFLGDGRELGPRPLVPPLPVAGAERGPDRHGG